MSTVIPFSRDESIPEDDEGLDEFLRDGRIWFNGFGFGSVAGALFTVAAAYVRSFFL